MSQLEMLDIQGHNERQLRRLEKGDMVEFKRGIYSHWAVYIGNEEVVHLAGDEKDGINGKLDYTHLFTISGRLFNKAVVRVENFFGVAGASLAVRNNNKDRKLNPLPPHKIVQNALSKLGEVGYNLIFHNCEHFASWCRYGKEKSDQVDNLFDALVDATLMGNTGLLFHMNGRAAKEKNSRSKIKGVCSPAIGY